MSSKTFTLAATNTAGTVKATASVMVAEPPTPGVIDLTFTEGVPQRINIAHLLPVADRFHGFYYDRQQGVYSTAFYIPGVFFEPLTKDIVYDGSPLSDNSWQGTVYAKNPNDWYWIGAETAPYNSHWSYPPRQIDIPPAVGGSQQAIVGHSKHTRPRYCPRDQLIHIFGGDYSTDGIIQGRQDGRMILWNFDPRDGKWGLDYPEHVPITIQYGKPYAGSQSLYDAVRGRAGEDVPLSPDIMGFAWDSGREIFWMSFGDPRPGVESDAQWKTIGGKTNAWPPVVFGGAQTDAPLFVFDPKLTPPRYIKLSNVPWDINSVKMREHAYDPVSKRLYKLATGGATSLRAYWLDTALYETDPLAMTWAFLNINIAPPHQWPVGLNESPMHVDEEKRLLYFVDTRTFAVLALTLPGHALGEHKVIVIAELPGINFATGPMGLLCCSSMPFVWIAEHRKLVLMNEPLWEEVGPYTVSFTIDVDTGAVEEGPRFPTRPPEGRTWFAAAAEWYPPTQELITYGYYAFDGVPKVAPYPTFYNAYKWSP